MKSIKILSQPTFWLTALLLLACAATAALAAPSPAPQAAPPPSLKEVIIVFKTHFDIGYTDLASEVLKRYRTSMIDGALDVCDQARELPPEQRFSWMIPGWPMRQILDWPGQTPECRARLETAIREGRIVWHAWPFTLQTESADLEDLVRGMGFSSALSRRFGQPLPRDAKMTDVPEHTWVMPTILRHAGIDFFHIGCNGGSSCPDVPTLFWWEGPDGSRVLTMYSKDYGTGLLPPAGWPHRTWLCMMMTGDNHGPPTPDEVKRLFAEAGEKLPGVKVRVGRLSDFYDALMKENPQNIPVIRKDMPDTWIHGMMSMPKETWAARNVRPHVAALESLDTQLRAWGVKTPPIAAAIATAYENSLRFSEHTWGMDVKKFGYRYGEEWEQALAAGKYDRLLKSFDEHRATIRTAEKIANSELSPSLQGLLAQSVKAAGRRIVVFNPTPWPRSDRVEMQWDERPVSALRDVATGALIPVEQVETFLAFNAAEVPAMGYRTYAIENSAAPAPAAGDLKADAATGTIENRYLKIKVDPARGGIVSLIDKRSGRELVDPAAPHALGRYLYQRFDANDIARFNNAYNRWDHSKKRPDWIEGDFGKKNLPPASTQPHAEAGAQTEYADIHCTTTLARISLTCPAQGIIADETNLSVRLYPDTPWVEIWLSSNRKKPDPWPEAGWLCLPFNIENPTFKLSRVGSIVDPARDLVPGSNHHLFYLDRGLTVTGPDGAGVGICPIDSPLVSLDRPGIWQFDREFTPAKPHVYVNLFNNQWSTNFPQWVEGAWISRVRIWAVEPEQGSEAALITPGTAARIHLLGTVADGPAGTLPPVRSGLELSLKGVQVTAFGPNPDGPGTILRLWERAGQSGPCTVTLPEGFKAAAAQPVDLRGRPAGQPLPVKDGQLELAIKPFAPQTLLFN